MPKPVDGLLPIINAGSSPQGRGFAARNADFGFTIVDGPDDAAQITADMNKLAREEYGRSLGVITISHVVVRDTEEEARAFYEWYGDENADWDAVDNLMYLMGAHSQSFTPEMLQVFRKRFAGGHGSVPLVGTPDQVAEKIKALADAGLAGITMAFFNYADELPFFAKTVLPRLEEMGVRRPVGESR
jgi:alkanesulfonate monooxygenase SsuD/methylene tetrahydromethanopterin reductase-like flavin-dependent oxidoreductase (luciferase family)